MKFAREPAISKPLRTIATLPSQSGWGLTIADHQSDLFAAWFTYRQDAEPALEFTRTFS